MEYFEFENVIRQKLERETKDFNVNQLLKDLDIHKKKNRFGIWFISISGLVLFTLLAYGFLVGDNKVATPDIGQKNELAFVSHIEDDELSSDHFLEHAPVLESNLDDKLKQPTLFSEEDKESKPVKNNVTNTSTPINIKDSFSSNMELHQTVASAFSNSEEVNNKPTVENLNRNNLFISKLALIDQRQASHLIPNSAFISEALPNVDCPDFASSDKSAGIELVAEFGLFKPIKTLRNLSMESNQILDLRQDNEKPLIGIQGGVYVKYNLSRSPFYIFGGANYSKISEKMNLDFVTTEIDTTIGVVSVTASELGDTITYIYGELYTETTTTGNKVRHYSVTNIDLPLHVGYELYLNRFSIGAEIGLALNVAVLSSGNFLTSQTDFSSLDEEAQFKSRVGLRYDGRLFAAYKIDQRQKLYVSANFNTYPSSFSTESQGTEQLYKSVGVNVGYGFLF